MLQCLKTAGLVENNVDHDQKWQDANLILAYTVCTGLPILPLKVNLTKTLTLQTARAK